VKVKRDIIIPFFLIWFFALLPAFLSVRRSKGSDWYAPITNRIKMIMNLINISVALVMFVLVLIIIIKSVVLKAIFTVVIFAALLVCFWTLNRRGENNSASDTIEDSGQLNGTGEDTLVDVLSKILTVFNSVFLCLNIAYVFYVESNLPDDKNDLQDIVEADSVLVIHATLLCCTTITTFVLTRRGWKYNDAVVVSKRTYSAADIAKRIVGRNKK
jgi:hypothetical protein